LTVSTAALRQRLARVEPAGNPGSLTGRECRGGATSPPPRYEPVDCHARLRAALGARRRDEQVREWISFEPRSAKASRLLFGAQCSPPPGSVGNYQDEAGPGS
jgi:hypothetical protein